ncbi:MAG TPA: hypothetical protein VD902_01430 [Symbiobacteriaceae bacterium]|nr:hypothetical protein [Symbiobacteriaceae bacterium]
MSQYIAGGLMILLLCAVALLGAEAYGITRAAQMVEAALLDSQAKLAADGGVTDTVEHLVKRRIADEGGDVRRLSVTGSHPRTPYGKLVTLQVTYEHDFALNTLLPGGSGWEHGAFRVVRRATTVSGWQP